MMFDRVIILSLLVALIACSSNEKRSIVLEDEQEKDIFRKETLLRTDEELIEDKFKSAISYCYRGETKKGLFLLKKKFSKHSKDSSYWNSIGNCYLLDKDHDKAMFYYKIGLSYNEKDPQILNNISYIYIQKKNYYKAYDILKKVSKSSNMLVTKYNLASLHFYFSKYEKSIGILQGLYRLNPKDPDLNLLLAKNYLYLGRYDVAKAYFDKIPDRYIRENEVSNYYSYNLVKLGKFDEAKSILSSQRRPSNTDLYNFRNNISSLIDEKIQEKAKKEETETREVK